MSISMLAMSIDNQYESVEGKQTLRLQQDCTGISTFHEIVVPFFLSVGHKVALMYQCSIISIGTQSMGTLTPLGLAIQGRKLPEIFTNDYLPSFTVLPSRGIKVQRHCSLFTRFQGRSGMGFRHLYGSNMHTESSHLYLTEYFIMFGLSPLYRTYNSKYPSIPAAIGNLTHPQLHVRAKYLTSGV